MEKSMAKRGSTLRPVLALLLAFSFLCGCGPSMKPFAGRTLKKGEGVKMAILPFENLSKAQGAGKSMENFVLIEFLKHAPVKIVDPGEVGAVLSKERVRLATSIPKETLIALGKGLGVDLFMMGTVHDFDMQLATGAGGSGQIPVVAVSLRILDASSGDIVWASNAARRGNDRETVFGIGRIHSLNNLAEETASEFAKAFAASLKKS
ncbi:MAG TPA: hypothetical protein DD658_02945 [Deltaproteobacteria bacterium]|nr:hypothetical protein [Deltaproteobacteria bacterium]